jgi:hypothetical protein
MELLFIIIVHGVGADGTDAEIIFLEFGLMKTLNFQRPQTFHGFTKVWSVREAQELVNKIPLLLCN